MFALILSNVIRFFVPLSLFVWGLFMPHAAGYTYVVIYALFTCYLILIDRLKPNPSTDKYSLEEIEIIKKYHLALKFSFGAKDMSVFLNGFRWSGFLWAILFLFNQMWIPAIFTIVAFFITADISVRLDPFFFLGQAVQSGQMRFVHELSLLKQVSDKLNAEVENRRFCEEDEEEHVYSEEVQQLLKKADELDKADRHEEAIGLYKKIIKIDKYCYDAYHGLIWIYGQMDIKNSSNEHADEMVALGKKLEIIDRNYDNYHVLAGSLADLGRFEEALEYYDKAIEHDKKKLIEDSTHVDWLEDNYTTKAKILFKLKRYEEALESYDNAIKKAIERSGDNKSCSELYAAKREIYCILDNIPMVVEMDERFAESVVLWDDYFNSEEYDASFGDRFKEIADRLKKSACQEVPIRRELSNIVLEMLNSEPPEELVKNKVRLINEKIDYVLEQVDFDKNLRFIEKAYISMVVNTVLDRKR